MKGRILRETDFVSGNNAVLCCTSVSEVCVLDRVRFGFDGTAVTDTIIVSLATGKVTRQNDTLQLGRANMRDPNGEEIEATKLIQAFKNFLHSSDSKTIVKQLARINNQQALI